MELKLTVVNERPPIWDKVKAAFDFDEKRTVFTYGDKLYNPTSFPIDMALFAHESVHAVQQSSMGHLGPARWWRRYLKDPQFRLEQELEAYRVQWREAQKSITDRNARAAYLREISGILSGPTYGRVITFSEAMRLIKQ